MSIKIPESHLDLISGPVYVTFTTLSEEGTPENTVVWCSWDGEHVVVNTTESRHKAKNVRNNPNVAVMAIDPENPYRWVDVRGVVEEIEPDKNYANINAHAQLYQGVEQYYGGVAPAEMKGKEKRIKLKIKPENVVTYPLES